MLLDFKNCGGSRGSFALHLSAILQDQYIFKNSEKGGRTYVFIVMAQFEKIIWIFGLWGYFRVVMLPGYPLFLTLVSTWNRMPHVVLEYSLVKQFRLNGFFFIVSMKSTSMCTTWNKFHVHEGIFYPGHQGFKIFRFSKMLKKSFFYSKSTKGYLISYKSKKKYQNYYQRYLW